MNIYQQYKVNKGFTLIELAVVLVIIAILLGSFIGTLSSRIENTRKSDTVEELKEIKQAMMAYAFVYGYLPCPDCSTATGSCAAAIAGDGISDYDTSLGAGLNRCFNNEGLGNVPWVTLGLGQSDSWGTRYRFAVQNEYANAEIAFTLDGATGPPGSAIIHEPDFAADITGATTQDLAKNIVAVLLSHGKNGYDGISENNVARPAIPVANIDELENTDDDQFYYLRPETEIGSAIAGGEFDDIVIWISEFELKAKMVEAGKLPSP